MLLEEFWLTLNRGAAETWLEGRLERWEFTSYQKWRQLHEQGAGKVLGT